MKIALGVCGGIAAYKACEVLRLLQEQGHTVQVIMTSAAQEFVRPLTFAALSGEKVITSLWGTESEQPNLDSAVEHISVAQSIDALVVVPATADTLAKFAHGEANDFLTTLYLATTAPVIVAPAMNVNMWEHPATQQNLKTLAERGVKIVEPGTGYLACGMVGAGRLAEPEQIVAAVGEALRTAHDLEGESILITTGPTYESIDPVRFIGNRSSGKMGFALAQAALKRGAKVVVIAGPTPSEPRIIPPSRAQVVRVTTAEQMRRAVMEHLPSSSIIIKAAAVADYRPKVKAEQKIKRGAAITVELEPNPDILLEIVANRAPGQIVIGFAAESENVLENGRGKLERKKLDAIVVNDVSRPGIGFDSDRNAVTIITPSESIMVPEAPKSVIAERVLDTARELRKAGNIIRLVTAR